LQPQKSPKTIAFTHLWGYSSTFAADCSFQQDNAPAHGGCEMVEFLARETPDFMPHVI